jgi:hypothetical protein
VEEVHHQTYLVVEEVFVVVVKMRILEEEV